MNHQELAECRASDLRFASFVTAQTVTNLLSTAAGRRRAAALLKAAGITKVYLDVFRGHFPEEDTLRAARDYFRKQGFQVGGGITTVVGKGQGKPASRGQHWMCWSGAETQDVITRASALAGRLFDEIIVDDFLCALCSCEECDAQRNGRDWPEFYRDQMVELSRRLIIEPAKAENPNAVVIIKYPQWYDQFHRFGYDVLEQPKQFDLTWAGTETRDPEVEYVQPYEAWFNHRWLRSLAGERMAGAWFDRIHTSPDQFVQQAYQSVLAGAEELIIFHYLHEYFDPAEPRMAALSRHFERLFELARAVAGREPIGVHAYKPADSEGADELYIYDYLGMFGIPLVPCSQFPHDARSAVFPRHALKDPHFPAHLKRLVDKGAAVMLTAGALEGIEEPGLRASFGYAEHPTSACDGWTFRFRVGASHVGGPGFFRFTRRLNPVSANVLASAVTPGDTFPVLTMRAAESGGSLMALSATTVSFVADWWRVCVGEPVPLIHLPDQIAQALRAPLLEPLGIRLEMPSLIGFYPFAGGPLVFENFGRRAAEVTLSLAARQWGKVAALVNVFTGERLRPDDAGAFRFSLASQEVAPLSIASARG